MLRRFVTRMYALTAHTHAGKINVTHRQNAPRHGALPGHGTAENRCCRYFPVAGRAADDWFLAPAAQVYYRLIEGVSLGVYQELTEKTEFLSNFISVLSVVSC